jgi:hypothetical protein
MRVEFEPCPKCGEGAPRVIFMVNQHGWNEGWPRSCTHSMDGHFDAFCRRCQYRWVAAAKEATDG